MAEPIVVDDAAAEGRRNDRRMSLVEHLREARRRILICCAALLIAAVVGFIFTDPAIEFISIPINKVAEARGDDVQTQLMVTSVTGPFDLRMKMAFTIAFFLASPIWIWQLWAFIMPAMTKRETRYTVGFTAAAVPLFLIGCGVAWWITPHVVELMATFLPQEAAANYDATVYFDFIFKLMLVVGIAFVLPVFLVALNLAGVMSGRAILKGWRVAILIATIFAAITTPAADVGSMLLLAGILIVLYFAAAGLSLLFDRRRKKQAIPELPTESIA